MDHNLGRYLNENGSISVGQYMERYGVGQPTAIKELNASTYAVNENGKPAKYKKDVFISEHIDKILDTQNTDRHTSDDFPLTSNEQIDKSITDNEYIAGYPKWILQQTMINKDDIFVKPKDKKRKKKKKEE